jgi:hypothetical protein
VPREEVRLFQHFEDYWSQLFMPTKKTKESVLLGISKVVGAIGFRDSGVAIRAGNLRTDWSVLKVIAESEFTITVEATTSADYLESVSEQLTLTHVDTQISVGLSLDSFEMLLRAAAGEVLADNYSDAVIKEVEGFTSQLREVRSTSVSIIDPIGNAVLATEKDGRIELVKQ